MKHKVHEAIKHAPDCLTVRPNLSQSQSESRAGANYFRLVQPLHALKCEQARGVWGHVPPRTFF